MIFWVPSASETKSRSSTKSTPTIAALVICDWKWVKDFNSDFFVYVSGALLDFLSLISCSDFYSNIVLFS